MTKFSDFEIKDEIKSAIGEMGFEEATPIQSKIIPHILSGVDCLAQAPTGTGKTCAFGIPLVNMVDTQNKLVQAVVLCPTRELAMQIERELKKLAKNIAGLRVLAIYGGQNIERQMSGIRKKPQIIVGTPGRMIDHLRRRSLKLHGTQLCVLDEADEMLNMGFREDIDAILSQMPGKVQNMLFSATMSKEILQISKEYQNNPVSVKTKAKDGSLPQIDQYFIKLREGDKYEAFKHLMREKDYKFVLVFCNTKRKVDELVERFDEDNYLVAGLHGDLRQRVRDKVMRQYRNKQINILVATDVAARGIDVDNIEAIFNYDIPLDEEYYVHRIGRTARANRDGAAFSFVTSRDIFRLNIYEKLTKVEIEEMKIDGLSDNKIGRKKERTGKKYFFNIGAKDDLDDQKMRGFVCANTNLVLDDIEEVKILDIFSFVSVKKNKGEELLSLAGQKCFGRKLNVELSEEKSNNSRGGRNNNSRNGNNSRNRDNGRNGSRNGSRNGNRNDSRNSSRNDNGSRNRYNESYERKSQNVESKGAGNERKGDSGKRERNQRNDFGYQERNQKFDASNSPRRNVNQEKNRNSQREKSSESVDNFEFDRPYRNNNGYDQNRRNSNGGQYSRRSNDRDRNSNGGQYGSRSNDRNGQNRNSSRDNFKNENRNFDGRNSKNNYRDDRRRDDRRRDDRNRDFGRDNENQGYEKDYRELKKKNYQKPNGKKPNSYNKDFHKNKAKKNNPKVTYGDQKPRRR